MEDLIYRQAAIDALVEELVYKPEGHWDSGLNRYDVEVVLTQQPSVDAVEVVRCKDCKHWYNGHSINYCKRFWDDDGEPKLYQCGAEDFCSKGERKDG